MTAQENLTNKKSIFDGCPKCIPRASFICLLLKKHAWRNLANLPCNNSYIRVVQVLTCHHSSHSHAKHLCFRDCIFSGILFLSEERAELLPHTSYSSSLALKCYSSNKSEETHLPAGKTYHYI